MSTIFHKVAGIYENETRAKQAIVECRGAGFDLARIHLLGPDDSDALDMLIAEPDVQASEVAKGAAAGAGVGVVGVTLLIAAGAAAVVSAPVTAALAALGVGAMAGGAMSQTALGESQFEELVREVLHDQLWVVIVEADGEARALVAQDAIARTTSSTIDQGGSLHETESAGNTAAR